MNSIIFLTVYVIVVNVIGFALMGIDKQSKSRCLPYSGRHSFRACNNWRQHRLYSGYVYVPSQNTPLVFCIWNACNPYSAGSCIVPVMAGAN